MQTYWEHRTTGDVIVVQVEDGVVTRASAALHPTEVSWDLLGDLELDYDDVERAETLNPADYRPLGEEEVREHYHPLYEADQARYAPRDPSIPTFADILNEYNTGAYLVDLGTGWRDPGDVLAEVLGDGPEVVVVGDPDVETAAVVLLDEQGYQRETWARLAHVALVERRARERADEQAEWQRTLADHHAMQDASL